MIWIIKGNESHEIISCNTAIDDKRSELWVTRPNGKSLKIFEGSSDDVKELKEAIDYAIKHNERTFTIE